MEILSHVRISDKESQSNAEHSAGVADLASKFAGEFGMEEWGRVMGLLHDKGKEKKDFQNYIKTVSGIAGSPLHWNDKTHAYVGALIAKKVYGPLGDLMTNQIAGHHAGLYDYVELEEILKKDIPSEIDCNVHKTQFHHSRSISVKSKEEFNHLYRMLYSCLVDADFLDTERFMNLDNYRNRGKGISMNELKMMLEKMLETFKEVPDTSVNRIRQQVQAECLKKSCGDSGFYSLTVPTGGGKTISSIVWAVNHAIRNGKKRIIIAIPYTSIIVQTACVLRQIFGEENVLEHHSNSDYEQIKDPVMRHRMKLATENWDYPIIVTTNVQLFESMYSNRPSDCRKLHNLCNSIIILDEVQTLPMGFLQPIVDALKCYHRLFGVSVLLTTASQPILSGEIVGCNPKAKVNGVDHIEEIMPETMHLYDKLRRVQLEIDDEGKSYDEVAEILGRHKRVLCIVNTRKAAKELYNRLTDEGVKIHLSRMMCPAHIRKTIEDIKDALKNDDNKVIRVVATQLIEAGVDIDFPVVFRQETGLDSVLQAAGRCNREGKQGICATYVFSLGKEGNLPSGSMARANAARKNIVGHRDWFAPDTMKEYFRQLYCRQETFDEADMKSLLYKPKEMCFETAAKRFQLIDDASVSVVINWKDSMSLVERLKVDGPSYALMKQLGQYSVAMRQEDFRVLMKSGSVVEVLEGIYVVSDGSQYKDDIGLIVENRWLEEILIK